MQELIFVSGSRKIDILYPKVINRLNEFINNKSHFIIGDCYGVDTLVQSYLHAKKYKNVTIVSSGSSLRCDILDDQWKIIYLNNKNTGTRNFYSIKDKYMTEICDRGLCIWNGSSISTKNNIERLLLNNKIAEVYINNDDQKIYKNINEFRGEYNNELS